MDTKKISAQQLKSIKMIRIGREPVEFLLAIASLKVQIKMKGNIGETPISAQSLYTLMEYLETLELSEVTVPPGKPQRGSTTFILEYESGDTVTLGMNLNEPGLQYYELSIDEFQKITELWMQL